MSDRIACCPRCHRQSLLVHGASTWCFSGCSFFGDLIESDSSTVLEPAAAGESRSRKPLPPSVTPRSRSTQAPPPGEGFLVRSAPTTASSRPPRRDVEDISDWSTPAEVLL